MNRRCFFHFARTCLLLFSFGIYSLSKAQSTHNVATAAELISGIAAAADNDIINITDDIVVSAQVLLTKTLTINGNNHYITVPVNGVTDAGIFSASPSAFRIFEISGTGKTVTINNLTLKGGNAQGACIRVTLGTLRMNNCVVSNGRAASAGGGGIFVTSGQTVFLTNCKLIRNSALYGGGLYNSSGILHIERSTFSENRSESSAGGGGAAENGSGTMFINNSTFSNNKSTEIGGAINNFSGNLWVMNSTFSGNVGYGSTTAGGAIGVNFGTVNIINSLFAYNYVRSGGTVASPTAFVLSDVDKYLSRGTINSYYNIFQGPATSHNTTSNNIAFAGTANGSDNTIFSNGILTRITDGQGAEIGTAEVYQPFLVNASGSITGTLQPGSFVLQAGNRGTRTGYNSSASPVAVGYHDGSSWQTLQGANPQDAEVLVDQLGDTRSIPTARGAVEAVVTNVYMFKVNTSVGGSVSGGSLYGDIYTSGTSLTVTAFPNSGYQFVRWDYALGGTGTASTSNPYTFMLTQNTTLIPVFAAATGGNYTVTYIGNGHTAGTPPAPQTTNSNTTIAARGTLTKTGYLFTGWNTNANGAGTSYAEEVSYSSGNNLTLYAQWDQATVLPVVWKNFNARVHGKSSLLEWSTAAEWHADRFIVQHSHDKTEWTDLGTVAATGASGIGATYSFVHDTPGKGVHYYRIRQIDQDGQSNYSKTVSIVFTPDNSPLKVYPNPVHTGQLQLIMPAKGLVRMYNMAGVQVLAAQLNAGLQSLQIAHLTKGIYTIQVSNESLKVLIQ